MQFDVLEVINTMLKSYRIAGNFCWCKFSYEPASKKSCVCLIFIFYFSYANARYENFHHTKITHYTVVNITVQLEVHFVATWLVHIFTSLIHHQHFFYEVGMAESV